MRLYALGGTVALHTEHFVGTHGAHRLTDGVHALFVVFGIDKIEQLALFLLHLGGGKLPVRHVRLKQHLTQQLRELRSDAFAVQRIAVVEPRKGNAQNLAVARFAQRGAQLGAVKRAKLFAQPAVGWISFAGTRQRERKQRVFGSCLCAQRQNQIDLYHNCFKTAVLNAVEKNAVGQQYSLQITQYHHSKSE